MGTMESAIKDKSSGGAPPPTDKEFDLLLADGDDFVDLDLEALANIIADCPTGLSDMITTDDDLFNPSAAVSKAAVVPSVAEITVTVVPPCSADDTKALKRERRRSASVATGRKGRCIRLGRQRLALGSVSTAASWRRPQVSSRRLSSCEEHVPPIAEYDHAPRCFGGERGHERRAMRSARAIPAQHKRSHVSSLF